MTTQNMGVMCSKIVLESRDVYPGQKCKYTGDNLWELIKPPLALNFDVKITLHT